MAALSDFSFGQRLGMVFPIQGGCLSAVAVSLILLLAVYRWLRRMAFWGRGMYNLDATDNSIFLNLMLSDLIQALGNLPTIRWMGDGFITEGRLCTAQAVLKQVGIVGVAMSSLAIAVHTFSVLILRWSAPKFISKLVVIMIWIFASLVIGIANIVHMREQYYGNTGYWCWILNRFRAEQIVTEYLWVWTALVVMAILYPIMYIVMKGWVIIDDRGAWHWYENYNPTYTGQPVEDTEEEKETKAIAGLMLYYPAVYLICVIPNTVSRWLSFRGYKIPYQFSLFANTLFNLSGLFNAFLFFFTRPDLVVGSSTTPLPAAQVETSAEPQVQSFQYEKDMMDYGSSHSPQFGSLPSHSPVAADYITTEPLNYGYSQQGPYNARFPLPNGAGTSTQPGLLRRVDSDSGTYVSGNSGRPSFYGDFMSMTSAGAQAAAASSPVEEEPYAYLRPMVSTTAAAAAAASPVEESYPYPVRMVSATAAPPPMPEPEQSYRYPPG